jgi:hypothetical protein
VANRNNRAGRTPWPAYMVIEILKLIIVLIGGPGAS